MFVTKRKVRKTLIKARDHIIEQGWTQHRLWKPVGDGTINGPVCALGALNYAVSGHPRSGGKYSTRQNILWLKADSLLEKSLPFDSFTITYFNDYIAKSSDEVIAVFNRAIKEL